MKVWGLFLAVCLPFFVSAQQEVNRPVPDTVRQVKIQSFIIPAVFMGYGFASLGDNAIRRLDYSTRAELQEDHPAFAKGADDYLRFAPVVAFYALNLAGLKSKHGYADGTGLLVLSQAMMSGSTFFVKRAVNRSRPDGSNNYSFPSGHTATAFASAEFLYQEYRDISPLIGYAGYAVATATGVFRLYNNRHWVSDVVAGAGFGIASTKLAYLIYPGFKRMLFGKESTKYTVVPLYQQKTAGISFSGTF
ncbi:phosphatase PAP2 family protein [Pedobacter sp. AW31-3R]|uniref:phosphatase PAP2 family protein n=1 Tax=Pedobacter sp. AW31-3R TaxID=3445781 RepID=UPI003F9F45D7